MSQNRPRISKPKYLVERVPRLKFSERRSIAVLVVDGDKNVNGKAILESLHENRRRELWDRFDLWISGVDHNKSYFHGWPNDPERKSCFVFKWKERNLNHRLYGFLSNPMPNHRPRFQVCVLVSHATKTQWETDPREINQVNQLRTRQEVLAAVRECFPDKQEGKSQWIN